MRYSWLFLTAVFISSALGQPCSPIRFNTLPIRTIAQSSAPVTGSGVVREADGSLTQQPYRWLRSSLDLSAFVKGEAKADFAEDLFACSGQTLESAAPAGIDRPFAPLPGVSSTEILVTNLTGDRRPAMLVFQRFTAPDAVIVGIFDEAHTLQSTATYPVGPSPSHSLAADFNADGRTDIAVVFRGQAGMQNGGVSVLLGNGDGTLQAAVNYVTGEFPAVATVAPLNAGDTPDIAIAHPNQQQIKLLPGQGDGTFGAPVTIDVSSFPVTLVAAKINGDGFHDLVFGADGGAKVMLGNGAGGFGPERQVDAGVQPVAIAAGDLNQDGRTDLAFGDTSGGVLAAVLGDGAGGFSPPKRYGGGGHPDALFISDFDRDGNADLVAATGHPDAYTWLTVGSAMAVLRGKGDGSFFGSESVLGGMSGAAVVTADFNGDGNDDLAVSRRGGVAVVLGRGDGGFQPPITIGIQQVSGIGRPQQIATGDLNGDETPDLVVVTASGSSGSDKVFSLVGRGDGTFQDPVGTTTVKEPGAVMTGDLNGDDRDDVVVLGSNGFTNEHGYAVHLSDGNGLPGAAQKVLFETTVRPQSLALGDANADQALDLFVVDAGVGGTSKGGLMVLLGNGTGGFGNAATLAAGEGPGAVKAADVNGDSKLDLLVTTGIPDTFDDQLLTFEGNGNGTFQSPKSTPVEFGPGEILLEDFSGDGVKDLIILHCCGDVQPSFLLGRGGGNFDPEVGFFGGGDPVGPAAADFNKDGMMDLAIASSASGASGGVMVMLNVGTAGTGNAALISAVINAASGAENPLTPGEFITIYGEDLGPEESVSGFAKGLGGTRVFVNGIECFVTFASGNQVNAVLTSQLGTSGEANVVVEYEGAASRPWTLNLSAASPGIFTQEFGLGQAWVVNQDNTFNGPDNPAARVSVVAFFATGQGVTDPVLPDGEQPADPVFPIPVLEVSVTIGGQPVPKEDILFAGLIYNGVLQVNVRVPGNVAPGAGQALVLSIGGAPSRQGVTMAVK